MASNLSNSWWDNYRETVKTTKRFRELVSLVNDREDVAQNMVDVAKNKYPNRSELWCLNKLVEERQKDGLVGTWSEA